MRRAKGPIKKAPEPFNLAAALAAGMTDSNKPIIPADELHRMGRTYRRQTAEREKLAATEAANREAHAKQDLEDVKDRLRSNLIEYLRVDNVDSTTQSRFVNVMLAEFDRWCASKTPSSFPWWKIARELRYRFNIGAGVAPSSLASEQAEHLTGEEKRKSKQAYEDALKKLGITPPELGYHVGPVY